MRQCPERFHLGSEDMQTSYSSTRYEYNDSYAYYSRVLARVVRARTDSREYSVSTVWILLAS